MVDFSLPLPIGYRFEEVAAFHGRDPQALAESVNHRTIRKGVILQDCPTVFSLTRHEGFAKCSVSVDGAPPDALAAAARQTALHLLALPIDPTLFESRHRDDAILGPLIRRRPGLRIALTATPFEALTWAIIGQQINLSFAITLRRSFIVKAGRRHSSGLWCYPGASEAASLEEADLTREKFSRAKAAALIRVARAVESGELVLEPWQEQLPDRLLALKGVGPWTVNYTMLRGYGQVDCALHGDAAVKNAVQRAFGLAAKPDTAQTQALLDRYRPHRSLAVAHLWASLSDLPKTTGLPDLPEIC